MSSPSLYLNLYCRVDAVLGIDINRNFSFPDPLYYAFGGNRGNLFVGGFKVQFAERFELHFFVCLNRLYNDAILLSFFDRG